MFERVPTIRSSQEILDSAFLKANKIEVPDPDKYHRIRKTEEAQMRAIADICQETVHGYLKAFGNLDEMPSYEREVLDILVGFGDVKLALSKLDWAQDKIREVYHDCARSMREQRTSVGIQTQKRRFSGRCASIMKDIKKPLEFLGNARDTVRMLPTVHPEYATVVIAGFPNVGKSSLLDAWTGAHPEIAPYAFTTKQANVGHFEILDSKGVPSKVQVVDTPGLLDRDDSKRNAVERQAVAALKHTADAVLFLLDLSPYAGYTLEEQERLLAQTKREMTGIPILEAETKADLFKSNTPRLKFSATTGEGLEELKKAIVALVVQDEPELEVDPLELWRSKRDPMFG